LRQICGTACTGKLGLPTSSPFRHLSAVSMPAAGRKHAPHWIDLLWRTYEIFRERHRTKKWADPRGILGWFYLFLHRPIRKDGEGGSRSKPSFDRSAFIAKQKTM
jgi:hypothetical protein